MTAITILHMPTHNVIISNSSPWQQHFSHTCHRTSYKPAQTLADREFLKCHPHREKTFCCQLMLACEIQKIAQSCISLQTSIRITVYFRILAIICTQMRHFQFTHAWCSCGISWAEFRKMAEGNNALTKWYNFFSSSKLPEQPSRTADSVNFPCSSMFETDPFPEPCRVGLLATSNIKFLFTSRILMPAKCSQTLPSILFPRSGFDSEFVITKGSSKRFVLKRNILGWFELADLPLKWFWN